MKKIFFVLRVRAIIFVVVQCFMCSYLNVLSQVLDTTFIPPAGLSPNLLALSQSVSAFSPLLVQPDGKIVLNDDIRGVIRLLPDGGLDPSWVIHPALQMSGVNPIHNIERQSSDKILIAGIFDGTIGGNNWIIRLNSNGSLDPTFTNVLNESPITTEIYDIAIQADDKILVAGNVSVDTPTPMTNLIRLMPNGAVDNSFITDSIAGTVWAIKVQPDGKILAGGDFSWVGNTACRGMCRFNTDGSIDNSFNSVSMLGPLDRVREFTVQADGKIIILTYSVLNVSRIIRLNSDGTEDTSFRHGFVDNVMLTTALQPDGKIIVAGNIGLYAFTGSLVNIPTPKNFMRLNSDGSIDNTFGIVGEGFSFSVARIKLLSSGKLLALGAFNQYGTTWVLPLVRLFPQAILAPSITTFSPSTGRQGDTITITGTNFTGTTSVQLGNMNVISFQVISATQIKAVIGSGSSGALTVRTTYGTATAAGFTFTGASSGGNGSSSSGSGSSSSGGNGNGTTPIQVFMPSITGISQNFGEFGSRIIIYGSRLDKTQSVRFGGVLARSFTINSENQITAVVGGGASGQITVQTSEGSASWYDFAYTQNVLPPAILSLNPTSITTGDGNYSLTLGGLNFAPSSLFTLTSPTSQNDITLQPTQVNSTQAIFTLPQTLRTVGSYRLSVANANSVVSTSYSISLGAKPLIHTISISSTVASSQPFTVSLLGDGFIREGSLITINNSLAKFSVISPLRAIVEIPREINTYGRESLQIRLTNYDGQSTTTSLRINGRVPPLITSVRPSWLNGGTTLHLIIEGSGFLINPRVTLGFQELQVVRSSPNQIEVLIPRSFLSNDAVVGTINLTVENFDLQRYSYLVSSNVFQQLTTSVQTDKTIDRVKIFPNPSADFINVIAPCSNYTTIIRNNVGAVVMTFDATMALGSAFRKELNVGALPTGAYSVEMLCGTGERFVARFVKF